MYWGQPLSSSQGDGIDLAGIRCHGIGPRSKDLHREGLGAVADTPGWLSWVPADRIHPALLDKRPYGQTGQAGCDMAFLLREALTLESPGLW